MLDRIRENKEVIGVFCLAIVILALYIILIVWQQTHADYCTRCHCYHWSWQMHIDQMRPYHYHYR